MRRFLEKLEPYIFYLFVFAVPFEKRLILFRWFNPFNEWASAYFYITDLLVLGLLLSWAVRTFSTRGKKEISTALREEFKPGVRNPHLWLAIFFALSAVSVLNSKIIGLSFYQLSKLAEFILLYFYLKSNLGTVFKFNKTLLVIMASGFFQAILGILQFFKQGSIGLRILGESPLSLNGTGVAVFIVNAKKYLRAYGTTPHPNVLAAWLFLAIFAFYNFYFYLPADKKGFSQWPLLSVYVVLLFGFFFTFSRVIIGFWALGVAIRLLLTFFKKDFANFLAVIKKRLVTVSIITLAAGCVFAFIYWPLVKSRILISAGDEAVTQRIFYNQIAGSVAASHPVFGIGIGQFVASMASKFKYLPSSLYQPVHNIYLLIASEVGFLGLAVFLLFLFFILFNFFKKTSMDKPYHFSFFIVVLSVLLMGLFDHLFWTLQQGSLIFWMVLALVSSRYFLNPPPRTQTNS